MILPVGIGEVDESTYYVKSVGKLDLKRMDYIGYVMYPEEAQKELERVVNGEVSFFELMHSGESE
jgi:hypothetical protein